LNAAIQPSGISFITFYVCGKTPNIENYLLYKILYQYFITIEAKSIISFI